MSEPEKHKCVCCGGMVPEVSESPYEGHTEDCELVRVWGDDAVRANSLDPAFATMREVHYARNKKKPGEIAFSAIDDYDTGETLIFIPNGKTLDMLLEALESIEGSKVTRSR